MKYIISFLFLICAISASPASIVIDETTSLTEELIEINKEKNKLLKMQLELMKNMVLSQYEYIFLIHKRNEIILNEIKVESLE